MYMYLYVSVYVYVMCMCTCGGLTGTILRNEESRLTGSLERDPLRVTLPRDV